MQILHGADLIPCRTVHRREDQLRVLRPVHRTRARPVVVAAVVNERDRRIKRLLHQLRGDLLEVNVQVVEAQFRLVLVGQVGVFKREQNSQDVAIIRRDVPCPPPELQGGRQIEDHADHPH